MTLTVAHIHPNVAPGLTPGSSLSVVFDTNTVFVDPSNPSATLASILPGYHLVIVWKAAPGTAATSLPAAARVYDLG